MMLEQIVAPRECSRPRETVDWQVIAACQLGDREALRTLFEAYKDRVYSTLLARPLRRQLDDLIYVRRCNKARASLKNVVRDGIEIRAIER